jgi:UTP--glucose-1-phosphate uridylyltransferase
MKHSIKGLIVAAGYGTRFLPVTKTIPKEMLPLIDMPSIAFIVKEMEDAGIEDIIIISSRRKKVLEDYFDREAELEAVFKAEGNDAKLEKIAPPKARISFVRQQEMRGTGHALLQAKNLIGTSPCLVAYPDDLHFGEIPLAKQLIDLHEKTGASVMSGIVNPPNLERYGVLDLAEDGLHVQGMVEKPAKGSEPSNIASIGRYLYSPEFFEYLEEGWKLHSGSGEYYHTHALQRCMDEGRVVYKAIEGERLDTGEPEGYLRAIIRYSAGRDDLKAVLKEEMDFVQKTL